MAARWRGVALVAVSAVAFGLTPFFARAAFAGGASIVTLMVFRFSMTAALLWGYLAWRGQLPARLGMGVLGRLLLLGALGYSAMSSLYYSSVRFISPSLAALLLYTYPVLVVIAGFLLFREPLRRRSALALVLALAGVALALGTGIGGFHPAGILLALGASVVYTLYIVLSNRLLGSVPPLTVTAVVTTAAALVFSAAAAVVGLPTALTPGGWGGVFLMTVVGTVVAVTTFFAGMALVGPARTSILSTLEPLVTILVGWLLYGDRLAPWQWAGAALVIASAVLVATEQAGRTAAESVPAD